MSQHSTPTNPPAKHPPPQKVYLARYDLLRLEKHADLGNFKSIEAALYPHKDDASACEIYVPAALLQEERARAFEEAAKICEKHARDWNYSEQGQRSAAGSWLATRMREAARSQGDAEKGEKK